MTRSIAAPAIARPVGLSSVPPISASQSPVGLRVVMVVANDVTRDSRVLREAAALAEAGHRVTVLGIMTARTDAPAMELRDGFVIRRLPFRARPPGWWIPPDFYARIRGRASRQYRVHRARLRTRLVDLHWPRLILALPNVRSLRGRASRAGVRVAARIPRLRGWAWFDRERWADNEALAPSPWAVAPPRRRAGSGFLRSVRALVRRASTTPLPDWPDKVRRLVARGMTRLARPRATIGLLGAGVRHAGRAAGAAAVASGRSASATGRSAWRAIGEWAGLLRLLVWGTAYLGANRASGGALEWLTGWRWRWLGWARYVAQNAPDADVWHGHDLTSLPAVVALKRQRGGIAVYDSHEIYVESGRHAEQPRWAKRQLERLERRLVAEVDAVITVNRSLAGILSERLGRSDIEVLYNCPNRFDDRDRPSRLRASLGLPDSVPLLMYHGSLSPHRGVEQLIAAIQLPALADAHLAFLGFGPMRDWIRSEAGGAQYGGRVHVIDAVRPDELLEWLVGVDVAVAPIQDSTLNHRFSSPNKLFEAIAVGTPVAGSDFPEFRGVIADPVYGSLGALFDPTSPEAIAAAVRSMLDLSPSERAALRERCRAAASGRWNWETEAVSFIDLYGAFSPAVAVQPMRNAVGAA